MKTQVQLSCSVFGEKWSAFVVAIELDARVEELRRIVAGSSIVNMPTNHVTLFWVKEANLTLPTDDCDHSLQTAIDSGVLVAMQDSESVKSFGAETVERDRIHVAVQLSSEDEENEMRISFHQHVDEDIGLKGLWQYSGLELSTPPTMAELTRLIDRPLPFQVPIRDQSVAEKLFAKDAPEVCCRDLSVLIDVFLIKRQLGMHGESASKWMWRAVYNHLLFLTTQICRANGFHVKMNRKHADEAEDAIAKQRTDVTIFCNNCVVFGGEEGDAGASIEETLPDWADKMKRWNCLFYGDLRYVLGYVTSGERVMLTAFCPYPLAQGRQVSKIHSIACLEEPAAAIRAFYNLAYIFGALSTLSKLTVPTDLSPFKPSESKLGPVELIGDGAVQLTIRRSRCVDGKDFNRIVDVYKNLEKMKCSTANLPLVLSLKQTHLIARKLVVQLDTVGFHRPPENVVEVAAWLQCILSGLQSWHKSGYCHGDVRWENIIYNSRLPWRWVLVNMETSCKSNMLSCENVYAQWRCCRTDLVQLGGLLSEIHNTKFPLTAKLLWVRDKLLAAHNGSESVTAEKVLLMMSRMRNSRTKNLREMVAAVLSSLETPDTSAESVLTLVDELVPPP